MKSSSKVAVQTLSKCQGHIFCCMPAENYQTINWGTFWFWHMQRLCGHTLQEYTEKRKAAFWHVNFYFAWQIQSSLEFWHSNTARKFRVQNCSILLIVCLYRALAWHTLVLLFNLINTEQLVLGFWFDKLKSMRVDHQTDYQNMWERCCIPTLVK